MGKIIFDSDTFTIISMLNSENTPKIDSKKFHKIKEYTLGKKYCLSLLFIGQTKAKSLNLKYRRKNTATDILSFDIDKDNGEIYIYPPKAKTKAKEFGVNMANFLDYLFIHGVSHLKGYDHHSKKDEEKMKRFESMVSKKFKINIASIHN